MNYCYCWPDGFLRIEGNYGKCKRHGWRRIATLTFFTVWQATCRARGHQGRLAMRTAYPFIDGAKGDRR